MNNIMMLIQNFGICESLGNKSQPLLTVFMQVSSARFTSLLRYQTVATRFHKHSQSYTYHWFTTLVDANGTKDEPTEIAKKKIQRSIRIDGIRHHIGTYDDKEQAASDYMIIKSQKEYIWSQMRDVNDQKKKAIFRDLAKDILRKPMHEKSSRFEGVSWHADSKKWRAAIVIGKFFYHIGFYKNEEEASRDFEKIMLQRQMLEKELVGLDNDCSKLRHFKGRLSQCLGYRLEQMTSQYQGIAWNRKRRCWIARIYLRRKEYNIGRYNFNDEDLAAEHIKNIRQHVDELEEQLAHISKREDKIEYFNNFASEILGVEIPVQRDTKSISENPNIPPRILSPTVGPTLRRIRLPKRSIGGSRLQ